MTVKEIESKMNEVFDTRLSKKNKNLMLREKPEQF